MVPCEIPYKISYPYMKDVIFIQHWNFKSSYAFLKRFWNGNPVACGFPSQMASDVLLLKFLCGYCEPEQTVEQIFEGHVTSR